MEQAHTHILYSRMILRFLGPPREIEIASRNPEVQEIGGKIREVLSKKTKIGL